MVKGTIVVVDDDTGNRESLVTLLEAEDFLVIPFQSGYEAMKNIKLGLQYNLMILDLSLGIGEDGMDVARESKTHNPSAKVFSYTGMNLKRWVRKFPNIDHHIDKGNADVLSEVNAYFKKDS